MANNEWYTPNDILELALRVLEWFDLDPASCPAAQERVRAKHFFSKEDNGLIRTWYGRVWLNPPFERGLICRFVDKLLREYAVGNVTEAIMLVDNSSDTKWFGRAARAAALICFTEGRIRFIMPDGGCVGTPPRGQALFYFGPRPHRFRVVFGSLGLIGKLSSPRK